MRKKLFTKFNAELLNTLPVEHFDGRIVDITGRIDAAHAVHWLLRQDILGFDTETRPQFRKGGHPYKVSILQVSTRDTCFIFRLSFAGVAEAVRPLLEDKERLKVGISWGDDIRALHTRLDYQPGTFVDIQNLVGKVGIEDLSLQKIYANLFRKKISKSQRLTNWDRPDLSHEQFVYAATDAWACVRMYEELNRLLTTGDYELLESEK